MEYSLVEGKKLNSTNYESEGFRYVKSRECETTIYLKCALFRTHSCLSIGRIDKITNLLEVTRVHTHDTESHNGKKILLSNAIKRKAEISTGNLREVFNETCRDADGASSVTFRRLGSSMFKRRRIRQPKIPSSVQEFDALLQDTQYSAIHIQTVLHLDQAAMIFGSVRMLDSLKESTDMQYDTTFKVVPKLFFQLFTIFVSINRHVLPALHILMTNKSEKLYNAVITTVQQLLPTFNPSFAIGDFELAPKNSFTKVFPHITIIGCWFHYTKAIYDKSKRMDYQNYIREIKNLGRIFAN